MSSRTQSAAVVGSKKEILEVQNQVAEIKLRAERKAGELLKEMPKHINRHSSSSTMEQLGIERKQSMRWQQIANVSEDEFE